jgi:aspartate-semialdehyde dehydrogenase
MRYPVLAIVGGESLMGREIREVLDSQPLIADARFIGSEDPEAGEPDSQGASEAVLTRVDEENLAEAEAVLLAGSGPSIDRARAILRGIRSKAPLIDVTGHLEGQPGSVLRAPFAEPASWQCPPARIHQIAHPAAIVMALVLGRLSARFPVRHSVVELFEPASERGAAGVRELEQQTVSLLSLRSLPKNVFDEQVSFNLLAQWGEEAPVTLSSVEDRIERHLGSLVERAGSKAPPPSLRLIQAPVFHGYVFSWWVDFETRPPLAQAAGALAGPHLKTAGPADLLVTNVSIAGEDQILSGPVGDDRRHPSALWFWMAADNLRLRAANAIEVARSLLPVTTLGRLQ